MYLSAKKEKRRHVTVPSCLDYGKLPHPIPLVGLGIPFMHVHRVKDSMLDC